MTVHEWAPRLLGKGSNCGEWLNDPWRGADTCQYDRLLVGSA